MLTFAIKKKRTPSIAPKRHAPTASPMTHSLHVQRAKVRHILRRPTFQPKLTIGAPNDRYEQEADRVADQVMRMPEPQVQRQIEPEEEEEEMLQTKPLAEQITPLVQKRVEEEEEPIQTKLIDDTPVQRQEEEEEPIMTKGISGSAYKIRNDLSARLNLSRSGGQPLPETDRSFMERRFGVNFSSVRVHTDSNAAQISREINAQAFTHGRDIRFGAGRYSPGTLQGKRLLAHELTHVVQQTGATLGLQATLQNKGEANALAGISRQAISVQPMIQRDLAIRPPRPNATGRILSAAEMKEAIDYNKKFLSNIPNSAGVIRMIRDVLGVSPAPTEVDVDFVNAVLDWQAMYRLTQDGKLGPGTARRLFREIGAEDEGEGKVKSGPRYSPQAPTVTVAGGRKSTNFRFRAEFDSDPTKGFFPSCCEVRQFIKWDATAAASFATIRGPGNTVPHTGFPAAHPANRWIEDRNATNTIRYGHRSRFSPGLVGNRYLDLSSRRNQAYGHIYRGRDFPGGPAALAGQWQFLVKVIDVCRGNRTIGRQDVIRVNW